MHIYKGKYAVLAPFWSIKRKQGRNWRTIIFILWFPTLLLISWHSLTLFSHLFVSLFELLKALWAVGWKHFPKCSLFIYCIREAKGPRAGCIYETRWQVEGPAESGRENEGYYPRNCFCRRRGGQLWEHELSVSFPFFLSQNAMQYRLWLRQQNRRQSH